MLFSFKHYYVLKGDETQNHTDKSSLIKSTSINAASINAKFKKAMEYMAKCDKIVRLI